MIIFHSLNFFKSETRIVIVKLLGICLIFKTWWSSGLETTSLKDYCHIPSLPVANNVIELCIFLDSCYDKFYASKL